jgi:hypothetical protein
MLHLATVKVETRIKIEKNIKIKVIPEAFNLSSSIRDLADGKISSRVDATGCWIDVKLGVSEGGVNEVMNILREHQGSITHLEGILHMVLLS